MRTVPLDSLTATATDLAGNTGSAGSALSITIDAIKRVQGLCNVNLARLMDGEPPLLTRLEADIELGQFEKSLRYYESQPWLKEKGIA